MSESTQQSKTIFEIAEEQDAVNEPVMQLQNGTGVNLFRAVKDIYVRLLDARVDEEIEDILWDLDLLGTLILSTTEEFAQDKLIEFQANILTEQLEREINND
jgi:hypothetical protein